MSSRQDPKQLLDRYEKAKVQKESFRALYESAFQYAIPNRNLYNSSSPGQKKTTNIYDSTSVIGVNSFVNRMQASLTPPFKKWVELKAGLAIPEQYRNQVNESLEIITETAFEIINASNFNVAVSEYYYDLAVGTGVLLTVPSDDPDEVINFVAVPIDQIAIEEGVNGKVKSVFRTHKMAAALIKETWPDVRLTADLQNTIKTNPLSELEVVECSYKGNSTYYYDVILAKGKERIVERQAPSNRWIVTRLGKTAGEVYGRGPVIQAIDDIKCLNKVKELGLRSAQLNAFGIYTVADSDVINANTLTLNPGSFIPVSRNAGANGPSIAPLPRAGDINMQQFLAQDLQANIKSILLNDKLPPEIGAVRSATEVAERAKGGRIDSESYYGRLMYEFVQPLWQNIISIMDEKGLVMLPPELKRIDNLNVKIKVLSPIAREQNLEDIQKVIQAAQITAGIGGQQLAALSYKVEDIGEWVAEQIGMPAKLIRSDIEREEMQQMVAQAMAVQQGAPQ